MKRCKFLSMFVLLTLLQMQIVSAVEMYSPDGRTINVHEIEVNAWKKVGWYDYPVTTMYAPDGRAIIINKNDTAVWERVGWFQSPVTIMYAPNGKTAFIANTEIDAYKAVGWYLAPVTTLHSTDGRSLIVSPSRVNTRIGWSTFPQVLVYDSVGHRKEIPRSELVSYLAQGWSTEKPENPSVRYLVPPFTPKDYLSYDKIDVKIETSPDPAYGWDKPRVSLLFKNKSAYKFEVNTSVHIDNQLHTNYFQITPYTQERIPLFCEFCENTVHGDFSFGYFTVTMQDSLNKTVDFAEVTCNTKGITGIYNYGTVHK